MKMRKILLLMFLFSFGCSVNYSDVQLKENDINKLGEGADSEAWCQVVYCVNGSGYNGVIKLQTFKINNESNQLVYFGISSDSHNEYKKIEKKRISNIKLDTFIKKLEDIGIYSMTDIDLEKLPVKENADNPWEDSFYKFPRATNFIMFYYYIKINKKEHSFNGFEIDIFKDERYKKIVELFNDFFEQRLGGLKFN